MMNFPAISIRTSTERPEAIDFGAIILGGINQEDILNGIETTLMTCPTDGRSIPESYQVKDVSNIVVRIIQSYTGIVNKVIWDKS